MTRWRVARRCGMLLAMALVLRADAVEDAAASLGKRIQARLGADEVAAVTWTGAVQDGNSPAFEDRMKALLSRALQRRVRNAKTVEIRVTWSANLQDYLAVAEFEREGESVVEMAAIPKPEAGDHADGATPVALEKTMIWRQADRVLDVLTSGEELWVLDVGGVTGYRRQDGNWQKAAAASLQTGAVRDPRGRLTLEGDALTAEMAGVICRGMARPALEFSCQPGGRFTEGRNTIQQPGGNPVFSRAEWHGQIIAAETDGLTHRYDTSQKPLGTIAGWGSNLAAVAVCGQEMILADGGEVRERDSVAVYDLEAREPARRSEAMELPGPVTALWPADKGAVAVIQNIGSEQYEAYRLTLDCRR